jgi:6-pyruvoyltetrahydropterin/6-carboxytetrahydropterin synthase
MYVINVEHSIDSAHFLSGYKGKCKNIHGHRWRVEVEVACDDLISHGEFRGMVVDFSQLKEDIKEIIDYYDHALIIEEGSLREDTLKCLLEDDFKIITVKFRTTAENFAAFFYKCIKDKGYDVKRVTIYETPTNSASYMEKGELYEL